MSKLFELTHVETSLISAKARRIIGLTRFRPDDQPDLEQQLTARLLQALRRYDPQRGHRLPYVIAVIERAICTVLRDASAAKRSPGRIASLNAVRERGHATPLADTIGDREQNTRRRADPKSAEELRDLHIDLRDVLARLPVELQLLCRQLMSLSKSEIALGQGIAPSTVQAKVRAIRQRFEDAGLKIYL